MPLDPSIILGVQQPQFQSPLDAATKALTLKSLATRGQTEQLQSQTAQQEFNDNQATRNAYSNNTTIGPDGTPTINKQGILSDLAKTSPTLVPKLQQQFAEQNTNIIENHAKMNGMAIQLLQGANDQPSWDAAIQKGKDLGLPIDQIPKQFDPKQKASILGTALTTQQYLTNQLDQQKVDVSKTEANIKQQQLQLELNKTKSTQNQETLSALQALRGNPALQRAETNVLSGKNINDLAEQLRDPKTGKINLNNANPQQISLFDHELVRMASGGSGSEADLDNLKPGTPQYKLAELHQKLTGKVSGADASQYLQQGLDYANTLSKSSNEFLYQNAKHVVDAKRNYLAPQDQQRYDSWLGDMKNGKAFFGDVGPASSGSGTSTGGSGSNSGKMSFEQWKASKGNASQNPKNGNGS